MLKRFIRTWLHKLDGKRVPLENDVFLVSYPKSGNTWLRFLVANLLRQADESSVDFHNIHDLCPEWERWDGQRKPSRASPMIFKSHQSFNPSFKRVVYIVRDPRDMYISYHKYSLPTLVEKWGLAEFIDRFESCYGRWSSHVDSWMGSEVAAGSNFFLIRYEDLQADPVEWVRRLADFVGLDISDAKIDEAIENSSFDSMQHIELEKGRKFASENKVEKFVRKGQVGEWVSCFGEAEWDAFKRHESIQMMEKMGYLVDAE